MFSFGHQINISSSSVYFTNYFISFLFVVLAILYVYFSSLLFFFAPLVKKKSAGEIKCLNVLICFYLIFDPSGE